MTKSCELLYADGDKYVWSVVSENEEEFPISASITAENSVWVNNGVKKVLGANGWVQSDPLPISENGNYVVKDIDAVVVDVEGGGGGDLSVATITIVSEGEIGVSPVTLYPFTTTGDSAYPKSINVMTSDGNSWFPQNFAEGEQITVNAGDTKSLSYIILPQGGVSIMDNENSKPTVEGNATVKTVTIEGSDYWVAEAIGDCTITFPAHR